MLTGPAFLPCLLIVGAALASLTACAPVPTAIAMFPPALVATDTVSMSLTGKTPIDGAYSFFSGRDCSTLRAMDGDFYCREVLPDNTTVETKLYCYRSLADIECYATPQPYRQNRLVAPPNQPVGARTLSMER